MENDFNNNTSRKRKLQQAVYLGLGILGFGLGIFAYFTTESNVWSAFALNFATELLGVFVVFATLSYFFFEDNPKPFLRAVADNTPLDSDYPAAQEVCISGRTNYQFLVRYESYLKKRVENGAVLRIIMVDPESDAGKVIEAKAKDTYLTHSKNSLIILKKMVNNDGRGVVELRYIDWMPSCSIITIDPTNYFKNYVRVTLYPLNFPAMTGERPHFVLHKRNQAYWYQQYSEQFEESWEKARPVDLMSQLLERN